MDNARAGDQSRGGNAAGIDARAADMLPLDDRRRQPLPRQPLGQKRAAYPAPVTIASKPVVMALQLSRPTPASGPPILRSTLGAAGRPSTAPPAQATCTAWPQCNLLLKESDSVGQLFRSYCSPIFIATW